MDSDLAYLCHFSSLGCVGVWGASAVTPLHEVWWVAPSARVGGSTLLLLLHLTLRDVFFLLFSLLPCLSVALIVSPGSLEGAPPAWVPPLNRFRSAAYLLPCTGTPPGPGNIGCLGTLKAWRPKVYQISPNSIDTFSLVNGRRMETFPGSHFEKAAVQ